MSQGGDGKKPGNIFFSSPVTSCHWFSLMKLNQKPVGKESEVCIFQISSPHNTKASMEGECGSRTNRQIIGAWRKAMLTVLNFPYESHSKYLFFVELNFIFNKENFKHIQKH